MTKICFVIKGNQEDPNGNPIPYFRTTQGSQWSKGAKRYQAWKGHVVANLIDAMALIPAGHNGDRSKYAKHFNFSDKKPLVATKDRIHMRIDIYFKNKAHADSDNIFKGIADALFMNDKYLTGEFYYYYAKAGRVEVTINL